MLVSPGTLSLFNLISIIIAERPDIITSVYLTVSIFQCHQPVKRMAPC